MGTAPSVAGCTDDSDPFTNQRGSPVGSPRDLHSGGNSHEGLNEGSSFMVRRPSEAMLDVVQEGLDYINTYLTDLAARCGQPPQQIVDRFLKQYARFNSANDWNRYSKYFTQHTEHELQRLQKTGAFTGSIDNTLCKDTVANGV